SAQLIVCSKWEAVFGAKNWRRCSGGRRQEQSSSEDEDDSSDDEDPIPQPTEHSRGHGAVKLSRSRLIAPMMTRKSQHQDQALRDSPIKMIPFTGACPYRQYLPMKPNPVGIKNFVCATADGIVLDFDLYQGKGALLEQVEEEEVGLGLGGLVLARLCQTLHRGTKVYCDRFFTSIRCVEQMMKKEMYITGTIMKNRLAGAKEKLPSDKTMKNTGRGTSSELSTEDGKLFVVKWYDNKPVLMMSVVHGTEPEDTCQRWDKKLKQYLTVSRPSIVREYNLKMGGVDLIDRLISYYRMSARTKKCTMRMLMHFTDLALANSWLLYRKYLHQRRASCSSLSFVRKWLRPSWPSITVKEAMQTSLNSQRKKMTQIKGRTSCDGSAPCLGPQEAECPSPRDDQPEERGALQ
ncbi:hypothetical protein KUCAC02_011513, partial [Chaenocephalus aceratus]